MTDGVRYSDFSPLPADQLAGDEKFVGLKDGVNVRLEGDWRGPMADLLRPYLGLGNLASINGSTVGLEFAQLPTPGDASWARVNDDGTVSLRTAAQTLSDLGASSGMSNPMTTEGDIIVGVSGGAPERLGIGSDGQVLSVSGGALSWKDAGEASGGLYKGPWEDQSGQAVPPYWVDYGGGENLFLYSTDITNPVWSKRFNTTIATVVDPTCPADTTCYRQESSDGESTYFIQASATAGVVIGDVVTISQYIKFVDGQEIYGFSSNDFAEFTGTLQVTEVSAGVLNTSQHEISYEYHGDGWYRVSWTATATNNGVSVLHSVNSHGVTSNNLFSSPQAEINPSASRYTPTTDTPAPYTPPTIYELQAPVDAIENEDDPITDGGTLWKEVGSGGGGGGDATGPYSIVPSVELSANDQDGSGNIAVTLDLSEGTVWTIDCTNSPLMSTNGNINVTVTGLPEDPNTGITFQVYFKQAGRKGVNWTLPAGVTASWAGTQSYGSLASSVDVVQGYWLSSEPSIMNFSIIDKR